MDKYLENKTLSETVQAFIYTEMNYFILAIREFVKRRDCGSRIAMSTAGKLLDAFEEDCKLRLLCSSKGSDTLSLLDSDALLTLLLHQKNKWVEVGLARFLDICRNCIRADSRNRISVNTWLNDIEREVAKVSKDVLFHRDKYRGML